MHPKTLADLAEETDALTYLNALKVTLTQIKTEVATQEELRAYMNESAERTKKLMKKLDGQYRMFARIVTKETAYATDITIDDSIPDDEEYDNVKEVMEDV